MTAGRPRGRAIVGDTHAWLRAGLAAGLVVLPGPALAQDNRGGLGGPGLIELPSAVEARIVDTVEFRTAGSTGDPVRDAQLLEQARTRIGLRSGDRLSAAQLELLRSRIERLDGVAEARTQLLPLPAGGGGIRTRLSVEVELRPDGATPTKPVTGMLAAKGVAGFPHLWRSEHESLRVILGGGHGVFTDGNPWFGDAPAFTTGNLLVQDPAIGADTGSRATWVESWIDFRLGGVTQLGDSNFALYGAATAIAVAAWGQDIFRDDTRDPSTARKPMAGCYGARATGTAA